MLSAKTHVTTNLATLGILAAARGSGNNWTPLQGNFGSNKGILVQGEFCSNKWIPMQGDFVTRDFVARDFCHKGFYHKDVNMESAPRYNKSR